MSDERRIANVTFQVGDVYSLEFADDTFDVVFAHALMGWLPDPVKALVEMKRVTKKGGWVVFPLAEEGILMMYPPCPIYDRVLAVRQEHWPDPEGDDHVYDGRLGRRALELLDAAGLESPSVESRLPRFDFAGEEPLGIDYDLAFLDYKEHFREAYQKLFSMGILDEQTVQAALEELENWARHPHASRVSRTKVVAAGQA